MIQVSVPNFNFQFKARKLSRSLHIIFLWTLDKISALLVKIAEVNKHERLLENDKSSYKLISPFLLVGRGTLLKIATSNTAVVVNLRLSNKDGSFAKSSTLIYINYMNFWLCLPPFMIITQNRKDQTEKPARYSAGFLWNKKFRDLH